MTEETDFIIKNGDSYLVNIENDTPLWSTDIEDATKYTASQAQGRKTRLSYIGYYSECVFLNRVING